jgi:hypothetical protein
MSLVYCHVGWLWVALQHKSGSSISFHFTRDKLSRSKKPVGDDESDEKPGGENYGNIVLPMQKLVHTKQPSASSVFIYFRRATLIPWCTRWFKYDRDNLWLVYTKIVPVIFEPPCTCNYDMQLSLLLSKVSLILKKKSAKHNHWALRFCTLNVFFLMFKILALNLSVKTRRSTENFAT